MIGQRIPYLVPHSFNGLRWVWSFDSQGFVLIFSQDLVIGLQSESSGKEKGIVRRRRERKRTRAHKRVVLTYLSRKSLSTTAEISSKGFPIPKSVFSLWEDKHCGAHLNLPQKVQAKKFAVEVMLLFLKSETLVKPCCRNIVQLQTYDFTLRNNFSELRKTTVQKYFTQ